MGALASEVLRLGRLANSSTSMMNGGFAEVPNPKIIGTLGHWMRYLVECRLAASSSYYGVDILPQRKKSKDQTQRQQYLSAEEEASAEFLRSGQRYRERGGGVDAVGTAASSAGGNNSKAGADSRSHSLSKGSTRGKSNRSKDTDLLAAINNLGLSPGTSGDESGCNSNRSQQQQQPMPMLDGLLENNPGRSNASERSYRVLSDAREQQREGEDGGAAEIAEMAEPGPMPQKEVVQLPSAPPTD